MIVIPDNLLTKHALGIQAAMNYYVYNKPTGMDDCYYDQLEKEARKDGIELRDYATQFLQGQRSKNADYILNDLRQREKLITDSLTKGISKENIKIFESVLEQMQKNCLKLLIEEEISES